MIIEKGIDGVTIAMYSENNFEKLIDKWKTYSDNDSIKEADIDKLMKLLKEVCPSELFDT